MKEEEKKEIMNTLKKETVSLLKKDETKPITIVVNGKKVEKDWPNVASEYRGFGICD
tara:strand:- start:1315 stop:1485 length:171 start_codon:yes stop_codon:yes gene_type:complete